MYKTYIFDLDGTLLDTLGDLAASTNYALRQFGMPEHSVDDVRRFVGNGVGKLIERAVPDGIGNPRYDDVLATFRKHYMEHSLDTTGPYPGIVDLLRSLRSNGCDVAVVSNSFTMPRANCVAISSPTRWRWLSARGRTYAASQLPTLSSRLCDSWE